MIYGQRFSHVCYQDGYQCPVVRTKFQSGTRSLLWLLTSATMAICMADFLLAAPRPAMPADRAVAKVVDEFFTLQPGYQKDDLISQSQIAKVVAKLIANGLKIRDPSSIATRGLADSSFL